MSLGSLVLHDPKTWLMTNLELHILTFDGCGLQLLCRGEACDEGLIFGNKRQLPEMPVGKLWV